MPGSGKSTLGRRLAEKLSLPFIDLDAEIEKSEGIAVSDIFSTKGEDYFRMKESESLQSFAGSSESFVMATGGGAPCFFDGIHHMNTAGLTIFLDVPIAELVRRLSSKKDRPLLLTAGVDELTRRLEDLLAKRSMIYTKASINVKQPNLQRILEALKVG